jgi:hypothetical protein
MRKTRGKKAKKKGGQPDRSGARGAGAAGDQWSPAGCMVRPCEAAVSPIF